MIDIFILITILAFWIIGKERGIIQELADILAVLVGFGVAIFGGGPVGSLIYTSIGKVIPEGLVIVLTSFLLFFVGGFLVMLIASAFDLTARRTPLEGVNKFLGGLMGALKGILLWWLIFVVIMASPIPKEYKKKVFELSILSKYFLKMTPYLYYLIKSVLPVVQKENLRDLIYHKL